MLSLWVQHATMAATFVCGVGRVGPADRFDS